MGNYADAADVAEKLKLAGITIDDSSDPTDTEVEDYIASYEAEIDGVLRAQGYPTIPASGTKDVNMLKQKVAMKVAAVVWMEKNSRGELSDRIKRYLEDYGMFINRLRRGEQWLANQSPLGEEDGQFLIVRTPTRDRVFTERGGYTDWDE